MGAPWQVTDTSAPSHEELAKSTFCAFPDMDAGEIKAWLVEHRNDPKWRFYYDYAFAKRPEFELYDVRKDPDEMHNVAADPMYADTKTKLTQQLMDTLIAAGDPRVTGDGQTFEKPPFTDPEAPRAGKGKGKGGKGKAAQE